MGPARSLLCAVALAACADVVFAFDQCANSFKTPAELHREISSSILSRAPAKHHALANKIKLITDDSTGALIPFAVEQQGVKIVVFPISFPRVLCKMTLATYLIIDGHPEADFQRAAQTAAKCIDARRPKRACLEELANELARRYQGAFNNLPAEHKLVAARIYTAALRHVAMHEYGHHFLNHFARIRSKSVSRIDAEFEADLFAILNGAQTGEPVSAMFYFFHGLAQVERRAGNVTTPDYESGACRAKNVDRITGYIGIAPMLLVDAAGGGGQHLAGNSPARMRSVLREQFSRPLPDLTRGTCGRIANVALHDALGELRPLSDRVAADAELLFASGTKLDVDRAGKLVRDLASMSGSYRHMNGLAAKCIAVMLRNWGLKGRGLTPLVASVDRVFAFPNVTANFMSDDYSKLLQAQGLAILQERTDLPPKARLDRSFVLLDRAVSYDPTQAEAWLNLAFIAFKRGDCRAASGFSGRAMSSLSSAEKKMIDATTVFNGMMRELAPDHAACVAEAARFHPYKGF